MRRQRLVGSETDFPTIGSGSSLAYKLAQNTVQIGGGAA
jgi:hypothetical protein